jgi:lipoprotein-releasing system permease protein
MKLEKFIAKRYFISKHKLNFITIISIISTLGIMIGVASLIIVLSVFNGFGSLVESFLTSIDPDVRIDFVQINNDYISTTESLLKNNKDIKTYTPYLTSRVLLESKYSQSVAELKGIEINKFFELYDSSKIIFYKSELNNISMPGIYLGIILANELQVNLDDTLRVFAPSPMNSFLNGFSPVKSRAFFVKGIFYSQNNQYDKNLSIIDLSSALSLFGSFKSIQGFEISLSEKDKIGKLKEELENIFNGKIEVLDKYEIHSELFSVMKIERWVAYLLLSLIIAVASFNILSSLTMTVLEKKRDISIMKSFGVSEKSLLKIFLNEGAIIGFVGTILGTILGLFICWLQIEYKIYPLDPTQYKIDSLPLEVRIIDFFTVAFASMTLSILSASFPASIASKTNLIEGIKWE